MRWGADVRFGVDDAGFVRAPADLVYRRLTDIGRWPTWWPGAEVRPLPPNGPEERWAVGFAAGPAFRLRCALALDGWRHEVGFRFALAGDLVGRGEFWLEPIAGGTIVHHLVEASTPLRRPRRVATGYRWAVRRGLWGLKDVLQLETRTSTGLTP